MQEREPVVQIRRCAVVMLEPREEVAFELEDLLKGGNGIRHQMEWRALAPHLQAPVSVDAPERDLLGRLSPTAWTERVARSCDDPVIASLIAKGLVLQRGIDDAVAKADAQLRAAYWHPLSAVLHAFTRWDGIDAVKNMRDSKTETAQQMRETLGPAPAEVGHVGDDLLRLPVPCPNGFDDLLGRRATCRNFHADRPLPRDAFAHLLHRVFAAQSLVRVGDDLVFLKKNVPSGGGLHPIGAYVIVQNVDGVEAGIYHYRADLHGLERVPGPPPTQAFVMESVGQQHWFADAHVLVALVPRFDRTFWKYREHAKAYRVVAMEAGHLSQTLYLAATDLGLGAFITAAINEKHLERALGLDPATQGVLAVCGFGWRADRMVTAELDPAGRIWSLPEPLPAAADQAAGVI